MIDPKKFSDSLINNKLGPIVQVPCSYFKNLLNYLISTKAIRIISPVNEAIAMGIASGEYLSTGTIPIVMIQNSGFLNTLNALTSLNEIYNIPIFYIISWRGKRDKIIDAPEHNVIGRKMEKTLKLFNIYYEDIDERTFQSQIKLLASKAVREKKSVALLIKEDTFAKFSHVINYSKYKLSRLEVINAFKNRFVKDSLFISSTGYPTRDSFTSKDSNDFYMVGSMGHTFAIALGIARNTTKRIFILDGDGSSMMHIGGFASFDPQKYKNIIYILLDNEVYESTGGQGTASKNIDFKSLANAFGFKYFYFVVNKSDLDKVIQDLESITNDSIFIQIKINNQSKNKSNRVTDQFTCPIIKKRFMENLRK